MIVMPVERELFKALRESFGSWEDQAWWRLIRIPETPREEGRTVLQWGWKQNLMKLDMTVATREGLAGQVTAPVRHPLPETIKEAVAQVELYKLNHRII